MRLYPNLELHKAHELEATTFITVRFSGEFEHNIERSFAELNRRHQQIIVDNRLGLRFATLGAALDHGLRKARHDLVAFVHEDVVLPAGFLERLAASLQHLEQVSPRWGLAGSVGWDRQGRAVGHWSDPRRYRNTLAFRTVAPVERVDEQFMLVRRSSGIRPDPRLPSIHGIGQDLALQARAAERSVYVIDAPTIHKYADATGAVIEHVDDSPKIRARTLPSYQADLAVADEFLRAKWGLDGGQPPPSRACESLTVESSSKIEAPVVLVGRGGGGTRLLSTVAAELGVFLGSELNESGDTIEMVPAVYRSLFRLVQDAADADGKSARDLQNNAREMLHLAAPPGLWGFKVPESIVVMRSILSAFPAARVIHLVRDPITTCLRRPHMTARPDNEVGRACLRLAYYEAGLQPDTARVDTPSVRMAVTTAHQVGAMLDIRDTELPANQYLEVRFEDLVRVPQQSVDEVGAWLGSARRSGATASVVCRSRARAQTTDFESADVKRVARIVAPLRHRLGYGSRDDW
jgi:hypothetical protein